MHIPLSCSKHAAFHTHCQRSSSHSHVFIACRRKAPIACNSSSNGLNIDTDASWKLLQEFTRKQARGSAQHMLDSPEKRALIRRALLHIAVTSNPSIGWQPGSNTVPTVLIGICSSDIRLGMRALRDYTTAFQVPFIQPESRISGCTSLPTIKSNVYIKYNSTGASYVTAYEGQERGVLVTLGSEQIGYLPLGLLDEAMQNPAPSM